MVVVPTPARCRCLSHFLAPGTVITVVYKSERAKAGELQQLLNNATKITRSLQVQ